MDEKKNSGSASADGGAIVFDHLNPALTIAIVSEFDDRKKPAESNDLVAARPSGEKEGRTVIGTEMWQAVQRDLGLIGLSAAKLLRTKLNAVGWDYDKYEGQPRWPARHLLRQADGGKACAADALQEVVVKCREELLAENLKGSLGGWLPLVHKTATGCVIEWMPVSSPLEFPRL